MDFIQRLLASILDSLKVKSPVLFFIIAIVLTALKFAVENANVANWTVPPNVVEWIVWASALVLGSRTSRYLPTPKG